MYDKEPVEIQFGVSIRVYTLFGYSTVSTPTKNGTTVLRPPQ